MKVTITESSATERQLNVEIPQSEIKTSFDEKLKKYSKQIKLNGFRPGKVPRNIVISKFGDSIRAEALEETMDRVIRIELEKAKIEPVVPGTVDDFKDDKDGAITFTVTVEVDPEITVEGYKELNVKAEEVSVPKEDIEKEVQSVRKNFAEEVDKDGKSEDGDVVKGKYLSLSINGENRDVPENPEFRVVIGDSATPDFDKSLIGVIAGEEKEVEFSFPSDYEAEELRGAKAHYQLLIETVAVQTIPEIDEEFLKKVDAESNEVLLERIEKNLLDAKLSESRGKAHEIAMDSLLSTNQFDVPKARILQYVQRALNKEDVTEEEVAAQADEASREIRKYRVLDAIAKEENIKVKQADVDTHIKQMAAYYGIPFEDLKKNLRTSGRVVQIREELKLEKTLNFLIGEVVTETEKEA